MASGSRSIASLASALAAGLDGARELGYRHRIAKLGSGSDLAVYRDLVVSCGLDLDGGAGHRLAPYNLLMTRDWMLVVPRSSGATGPIEVNALGFAGTLVGARRRGPGAGARGRTARDPRAASRLR